MTARAAAMEVLSQQCEALGVAQPALAQQVRFAFWECDHMNNVKSPAVRGSRKLKVRVCVREGGVERRLKGG